MSIQERLDAVATLSEDDANALLQHVARALDAPACVYVFDSIKSRRMSVHVESMRALERVEKDRGRACPTYRVARAPGAHLTAERRIHKICKGKRLSERNDAAKQHLEAAAAFVRENRLEARSSAAARMACAKAIAKHLGINKETARGVVTSLKRRGVL